MLRWWPVLHSYIFDKTSVEGCLSGVHNHHDAVCHFVPGVHAKQLGPPHNYIYGSGLMRNAAGPDGPCLQCRTQ